MEVNFGFTESDYPSLSLSLSLSLSEGGLIWWWRSLSKQRWLSCGRVDGSEVRNSAVLCVEPCGKVTRCTAESTKQAPHCSDLANLAGSLSRRDRRLHILYCVLFLIRRVNYQVTNIRTRHLHPSHASLWAPG